MVKKMSKKNDNSVYLVGTVNGLRGYCCDKSDAKELVRQRKKKDYSYVEFNLDNKKRNVDLNFISEAINIYGVFLFRDEEEMFLQSFEHYKMDLIRHCEKFLKLITFLKIDDDEYSEISTFLNEIEEYISGMKHGTLYDNEECSDNDYWSYAAALEWYMKAILKSEIDVDNVQVDYEAGGGYY